MPKFTDRYIKNLKPKSSRYEVYSEGEVGFGMRVNSTGVKTWITRYKIDGATSKHTHGEYPDKSLEEARELHQADRKAIRKGKHPQRDATHTKHMEKQAETIKTLADEYIEKWAKPHKRSWEEDERMLQKDVVKIWGERKVKDITRRDIIKLLDKIVDRGSPVTANRVLALVRKMFNFAIERDMIEASPCVMVRAPGKEKSKDRVLTEDEIKTFWKKLYSTNMATSSKLALKLLLLTAQRRGEVATAEKKDFNLESCWWTIPAEKAKNGLAQRVPLSPQAINIIERAKQISEDKNPYLFPSPRGKKSMTATALTRAVSRNRDTFGISSFTPHDLRRTAASMMASSGIERLVISKILNHAESGITAVYDRHSYDKEKQQALESWGRKLLAILSDRKSNIIPITASKLKTNNNE